MQPKTVDFGLTTVRSNNKPILSKQIDASMRLSLPLCLNAVNVHERDGPFHQIY
jgi:hypothetical protein